MCNCCGIKELKIKKLNDYAILPTTGSERAAGLDLYACVKEDVEIAPQDIIKIGTGIAITPPAGYFGAIFARSGMATKKGLRPANCVGVVDEDYTGEVIVALYNDSDEVQTITSGDRIAQLILLPYITDLNISLVDELEETERADGGFGSTGEK